MNALRHAVMRAEQESSFLAYDLARHVELSGEGRDGVAHWLEFDVARYDELALCRTPRRGADFRRDIEAVAALVGANAVELARIIRLVDALAALSSATPSVVAPMLAAARQAN